MQLWSAEFGQGRQIPVRYTCDGANIAPPLEWSGIPVSARSLALIMEDPDAPDPKAPKFTWVHWIIYNIPVHISQLPEGITSGSLPTPAQEGKNDWQRVGYGGACPPVGQHRYYFKLYALDTLLEPMHEPTKAAVESAMTGHIVAYSELMGVYQKSA